MSNIKNTANKVGQLFLTLGFISILASTVGLLGYAFDIINHLLISMLGMILGCGWFIGGLVVKYHFGK